MLTRAVGGIAEYGYKARKKKKHNSEILKQDYTGLSKNFLIERKEVNNGGF